MDILIYLMITVVTIAISFWIARYSVNISYKISVWAWLWVDFATFWLALLLMLCCSSLNISMAGTIQSSFKVDTWIIIFIRQGGGVIFVTFFAGIINRILIQGSDLDKMKSYSTIYSRINFTLIGIVCSYICLLDAKKDSLTNLDNAYLGQSIMWGIVIVEAWISFEGLSEKRNKEKIGMKNRVKNLYKQIRKYAWKPLFSLLIGPLSFGLLKLLIIDNNIELPVLPVKYIRIDLYGVILFVSSSILIKMYRNPSTEKAEKRLNQIINRLTDGGECKTYFYDQRVIISRKEDLFYVKVVKWKITIGKKNVISKKLKKEIKKIFNEDNTEKYRKNEVDKILLRIKNIEIKRTNLLKSCFNQVQENYINSEENY